jgi:hypothetical protein
MHGQGLYIWKNPLKTCDRFPFDNWYHGEWKHGKRHGQGTFQYSTGAKYIGEWKDNMKVFMSDLSKSTVKENTCQKKDMSLPENLSMMSPKIPVSFLMYLVSV